jgi:DNA-binding NtrC family response regulator
MYMGPRIVVYDDDRVTALGLSAMLGDAGYDNVQTISNSKNALAALEQWMPIELLVSDIVVPGGLDGISLAKLAQLLQPYVSVIFVTGYAIGPVERAMGWPILPKPVCYTMLIAEVNRALGFRTDSRTIRSIERNRMLTAATERAGAPKGRTKLEMALRHVREGLERLERQRGLISDLIRGGHHSMVPAAQKFLAEMEQYQSTVEHHLEQLLRKQ